MARIGRQPRGDVADTGEVFTIEAVFKNVAPCPTLSPEQVQLAQSGQLSSAIALAPVIESRSRRQSDVAQIALRFA